MSVTSRVAEREPAAAGANFTLIAQDPPASTLVPQLFVSEKSVLFAPAIETVAIESVLPPVLVSVTVCVPPDAPTDSVTKSKEAGENDAAGPGT